MTRKGAHKHPVQTSVPRVRDPGGVILLFHSAGSGPHRSLNEHQERPKCWKLQGRRISQPGCEINHGMNAHRQRDAPISTRPANNLGATMAQSGEGWRSRFMCFCLPVTVNCEPGSSVRSIVSWKRVVHSVPKFVFFLFFIIPTALTFTVNMAIVIHHIFILVPCLGTIPHGLQRTSSSAVTM